MCLAVLGNGLLNARMRRLSILILLACLVATGRGLDSTKGLLPMKVVTTQPHYGNFDRWLSRVTLMLRSTSA